MGVFIRCLGMLLAVVMAALPAQAQSDYPNAAVKIIVANTPGTSGDNLVRVLAARLSEVMGRQFYIINHPGAGGTIGSEIAARATPDGYTILATSTPSQVIAPHLYKNLKYKPLDDFAPLMMFAKTENVLVTHPSLPFQNVRDIIAYGKQHPGKLKMANAGVGFQSHLANVMFANMAGFEALQVSYKGAASMISVMGGECDMTISPLPATIPHIRSGKVKALAVGGAARSTILPDLPTIHESGLPGFQASGWNGLLVPKGTSPDIVARLTAAITKVLGEEALREQLVRAGGEPWLLGGADMVAFIREDYARYGEAVRAADVKLE